MKKSKRVLALLLAAMFLLSTPGQTLASYGVDVGTDNRLEDTSEPEDASEKEENTGTEKPEEEVYPTGLLADEIIEIDVRDINMFTQATPMFQSVSPLSEQYEHAWDTYSTNYFYNLSTDAEKVQLWDALDEVCRGYLATTADAIAWEYNGTTYYHIGFMDVEGWTDEELHEFVQIFRTNNPQYYFLNNMYISGGYDTSMTFSLGVYDAFADGEARAEVTEDFGAQVDAWKSELSDCETEEEIVFEIHKLICEKVDYNYDFINNNLDEEEHFTQSAYSVMCMDLTVCAGYAEAFALMCNAMGVDAICVTSYNHQWNKVRIEDQWYNVDATWADMGEIYYEYYLRNDAYYDVQGGQVESHEEEAFWEQYLPNCNLDSNPSNLWAPGTLPTISQIVEAPLFKVSYDDGWYSIEIASATQGATVYYTIDGTEPSVAFTKAFCGSETSVEAIAVTQLKAIAVMDGYYDSPVVTWDGELWSDTTFTVDGICYEVLVDQTVKGIVRDNLQGAIFTVPATVNGYTVTEIQFMDDEGITEVTLSENIRDFLLSDMTDLEQIEIDENNPYFKTVDGIVYNKAMDTVICCPQNYQEEALILPDTVRIIETQAFYSCNNIVRIELPDEVYQIRIWAFSNCEKLEEIHVEYHEVEYYLEDVLSSEEWPSEKAFNYLEGIAINEEAWISGNAFENNQALISVDIPAAIQYGTGATMLEQSCAFTIMPTYQTNDKITEFFADATKVYSYTGTMADAYCACYDIPFESMKEIDKIIYLTEKLDNNEIRILAARIFSAKEYEIPETIFGRTVTEIGARYEYYVSVFPTQVRVEEASNPGSTAPDGACRIERLILPDTLRVIGKNTFHNIGINEVVMQEGLETIEFSAFFGSGIEKLDIPNTVVEIEGHAFACSNFLTEVTIPESVEELGGFAFSDCEALTKVTLECKVKDYLDVFMNTPITELEFPDGAIHIYLRSMPELESVTFSETVSNVQLQEELSSLTEINIPGEVFEISGNLEQFALNECVIYGDTNSEAEKIALENGITFQSVGEIEKVDFTFAVPGYDELPEGERYDGRLYIKHYIGTGEETLVIPEYYGSRKIVGFEEYGVATQILSVDVRSVIIPEGIEVIHSFSCLDDIPSTEITIPRSVRYIGQNGFYIYSGNGEKVCVYGYPGSYVETWVEEYNETITGSEGIEFRNVELDRFVYETVQLAEIENTGDAFKLSWEQISDADGYYVYRNAGNDWVKIATLTGGATLQYTDANIESDNEYTYCVKAYKGSLESRGTEASAYYLEAPTVQSLTQNGDALTITWDEIVGAEGYSVTVEVNGSNWNQSVTGTSATFYLYDSYASAGDLLLIYIEAFNDEGWSKWDANIREYVWDESNEENNPDNPDNPIENPFADVSEDAYYYEPVLWAYENGITSGYTPTEFGTNGTCTRGEIVTFLWRAMGSPEPTTTVNPFTDVPEGIYYEKAVLWAYENGITSGLTESTFGPDKGCTREQIVTFLWRAMGRQEPTITEHSFSDVPAGEYYTKAVLWAKENGITSGLNATSFGTGKTCIRADVVSFLYRTLV